MDVCELHVKCPLVGRNLSFALINLGPQIFYAYTYGTAAWFGLQGLVLVSGPRLIVTLLLDESRLTPSGMLRSSCRSLISVSPKATAACLLSETQ